MPCGGKRTKRLKSFASKEQRSAHKRTVWRSAKRLLNGAARTHTGKSRLAHHSRNIIG